MLQRRVLTGRALEFVVPVVVSGSSEGDGARRRRPGGCLGGQWPLDRRVDARGWFVGGVVLVVVSLGPVKSYMVATGASALFGEFSDAIGLVGRLVVSVAVAAVILWVVSLEAVPGSSVFSLGNGGLLAVAGVVAIKLVRHRELAG